MLHSGLFLHTDELSKLTPKQIKEALDAKARKEKEREDGEKASRVQGGAKTDRPEKGSVSEKGGGNSRVGDKKSKPRRKAKKPKAQKSKVKEKENA